MSDPKVLTCLWFNHDLEEVAEFYVSLMPDSHIDSIERVPKEIPQGVPLETGKPMLVQLTLGGVSYQLLNGGVDFPHSEAASLVVYADDQNELDRLWSALIADGGREVECGWCVDRFGLRWQVIPRRFIELMNSSNPETKQRVLNAVWQMKKIEIADIEAAVAA
ncbi:VOC family protein [Notoacmeibacter sp. MSK16QG-6]|uniref:VOC family protein n=1 Tax=Notoacmeibacter sp. MSK16QG-6 TaxID=2957982 RepID=UPI00209E5938|nr:VOC family protein [Notoacmeibacter sp. MSK16QG-6]MCP1198832.1 VOC family protein [Notoacmeibacter sp. MSK16QG-6]